jgi:hypothetical protein
MTSRAGRTQDCARTVDGQILSLSKDPRDGQIEPSQSLEGKYNLTSRENRRRKKYTYIKTMYEITRRMAGQVYVVVPSRHP